MRKSKLSRARARSASRSSLRFEHLETRQVLAGTPVITEFMAVNDSTLADEDGVFSDWIELFNPDDAPLNLQNWHLTDNDSLPAKWTFPNLSLGAGQYLLVYASNNDRLGTGPLGQYHTNFKLDGGGEYLALTRPDNSVAQQFISDAGNYPQQFGNISYGMTLPAGGVEKYFLTPTPGAVNSGPTSDNPAQQIVINEVMYHPPEIDETPLNSNDLPKENFGDEWIELKNIGGSTVNLTGWTFTNGVTFTFPSLSLAAGQYAVVAADTARFMAQHSGFAGTLVGGWLGQLSNNGETIELQNTAGQLVDRVDYADQGDWALRREVADPVAGMGWDWIAAHDGGGRTLELAQPLLSNNQGQNWQASTSTGGTPGAANAAASANIAPMILNTDHFPAVPRSDQAVFVTAEINDELSTGLVVTVYYRDHSALSPGAFIPLTMLDDGLHNDGFVGDGVYGATIPAQPVGSVIEYYVEALDGTLPTPLRRTWPAGTDDLAIPTQGANALYLVDNSVYAGLQPVYQIVMTETERQELASLVGNDRYSDAAANVSFISLEGSDFKIRHNSELRYRGAGSRPRNPPTYRLNIASDRKWNGVTALNLNSQYTFNQVIGNAIFKVAGLVAPEATPVQIRLNGADPTSSGSPQFGSYTAMQVIDTDFLDAHLPADSGGNAYRGIFHSATLDYLGLNQAAYINRYDKLTNGSQNDYSDLVALTNVLNNSPDATFIADVNNVINVDQWLRSLALHNLLSNNETNISNANGDDYVMYRGLADQRFILIPHDLDTILGQGDTPGGVGDSIFRPVDGRYPPTEGPEILIMGRFLLHPQILPRYYQAIEDLAETVLSPAQIDPLLENVLGSWVDSATIDAMQAFAVARVANALSQIPQTTTVTSTLPVVNGFPQSTTATSSEFLGTANGLHTEKVLINGVETNWNPRTGQWTLSSAGGNSVLVPEDSVWKYLDNGTNQGGNGDFNPADATWFGSPLYNDAAAPWVQLNDLNNLGGEYGYGDTDETTRVDCGPDASITSCSPGNGASTNYITTYFRKTFTVVDPGDYLSLTLRVQRDDGVAVYLNGVDITDDTAADITTRNLPANPTFTTPAGPATIGQAGETAFNTFTVNPALLNAGTNTLAVEMHQNSAGSSDISFNLELLGTLAAGGTPVPLQPGINRLLVQELGPGDIEAGRTSIDVWYDDGSVANVSGALPAGTTTWTAAGGPYNVTANVTVGAGSILVIEPGTTVYFAQGTSLNINAGGVLSAVGTDRDRIRLTRAPGTTNTWGGVVFTGSAASTLSYFDQDYATSGSRSINIVSGANATIDHGTWTGTTEQIVNINNASFRLLNSVIPSTSGVEPVHTSGMPAGGFQIIQGNLFGRPSGFNDVVDATGGNRPGSILQILDNVFLGSEDDILDLDGTDAHIEGNVFMGAHLTNPSNPDTSSAVSGGQDAGNTSELVVVRNFFYDLDHALLVKEGNSAIFAHNTVVNISVAAINFDEPLRSGITPGLGVRVDSNIFQDVPLVLENLNSDGSTTQIAVNRTISNVATGISGVGNFVGDARLLNTTAVTDPRADFMLRPGSPAFGAGFNGRDIGAAIPAGASVSGEPLPVTNQTSATLAVGGVDIYGYKYKVNNGAWSAEQIVTPATPAAAAVIPPIVLTGLTNGAYTVYVAQKNSAGVWQPDAQATASRTWTVDTAASGLRINEVLAHNVNAVALGATRPDAIEFHNAGPAPILLADMSISDNAALPRKYVFPAGTMLAPGAFLVVYADGLPTQGGELHSGFSLKAAEGDGVFLYNTLANGGGLLDSVVFGSQLADYSIGRIGSAGAWTLNTPTIGGANVAQRTGDPSVLKINEWLTDGSLAFPRDFIELYNPDPLPMALGGLFLTDYPGSQPTKHPIAPLSYMGGSRYFAFTADSDPQNGADHVNFKLSPDQGLIGLFAADQTLIDYVVYGAQTSGVSQGRVPDGGPLYQFLPQPSPGIDVSPPTTPTNLHFTFNSDTRNDFAWDAASDPQSLVAQYRIYRNAVQIGVASGLSYSDTTALPGNEYAYQVSAVNGDGVEGTLSDTITSGADTTPPTKPTNLSATLTGQTQVNLTWTAATDAESDVVLYRIYRNGAQVGTSGTTNFSNPGLAVDQTYYFEVSAVNSEALEGSRSARVTVARLQEGVSPAAYAGTTDTYLNEQPVAVNGTNNINTNYGTATSVLLDGEISAGSRSDDYAALVRWNLSSIPANSIVTGADMVFNVTNLTNNSYGIFQLKRDWAENEATWNLAATGTSWQTPGAQGTNDRGSVPVGSMAPSAQGTYVVPFNGANGVPLVQGWIAGTTANYGVIMADTASTDGVAFDSSESSTPTNRPRLSIIYREPDAVDTTPPTVVGVSLNNSGSAGPDFNVPVGSGQQLVTAERARINRVRITFSEQVAVVAGDLSLTGLAGAYPSFAGFSTAPGTVPGTFVATWTLAAPINADRVTLQLGSAVKDLANNVLDGEWDNPISLADALSDTYPSGNGAAGGNFQFKLTVLPGDANRDNRVDAADYVLWQSNYGVGGGTATWSQGDTSGDGFVTAADYTQWADNFNVDYTSPPPAPLPTGDEAAQAADEWFAALDNGADENGVGADDTSSARFEAAQFASARQAWAAAVDELLDAADDCSDDDVQPWDAM